MKCKACSEPYPSPYVIDKTAYFVCEHCGDAYEIDDYQALTPEQALAKFEKEYRIKFPKEYIELSQSGSSWVFQDPSLDVGLIQDYFEQGRYELGGFMSLDPYHSLSLFNNKELLVEWALPRNIVPIEGDGHTWVALDYRKSKQQPSVIFIESETRKSVELGKTFKEFLSKLTLYKIKCHDGFAKI